MHYVFPVTWEMYALCFVLFFVFLTGLHYVVQASLELIS